MMQVAVKTPLSQIHIIINDNINIMNPHSFTDNANRGEKIISEKIIDEMMILKKG